MKLYVFYDIENAFEEYMAYAKSLEDANKYMDRYFVNNKQEIPIYMFIYEKHLLSSEKVIEGAVWRN